MSEKIYMQNILEHYHKPENYGELEDFTNTFVLKNSSCGDVIEVWLKVEEGVIVNVGFEGQGCAISQASMSILSEELKGQKVEDILKIDKDFLLELLGISLSPTRLKCALMSIEAVKKSLS